MAFILKCFPLVTTVNTRQLVKEEGIMILVKIPTINELSFISDDIKMPLTLYLQSKITLKVCPFGLLEVIYLAKPRGNQQMYLNYSNAGVKKCPVV